MQSEQSVESWARTTQFAHPVQWGEIERTILAWDIPRRSVESLPNKALALFGLVGSVVLGLVTGGAPLVGLVLIVVGSVWGGTDAGSWFSAAFFLFVISIVVQLFSLNDWRQVRRRLPLSLLIDSGAVLASVASALVLVTAVGDVGKEKWLLVAIVVAGVLGAVSFGLNATSEPEGRDKSRKPPRRGPRNSWKWRRYSDARDRVLEILVERGVVDLDESDQKRVSEMPLGYWEELDGVDEKEWRRILEYRFVGWRDFDESDARPWPPAAGRQ